MGSWSQKQISSATKDKYHQLKSKYHQHKKIKYHQKINIATKSKYHQFKKVFVHGLGLLQTRSHIAITY